MRLLFGAGRHEVPLEPRIEIKIVDPRLCSATRLHAKHESVGTGYARTPRITHEVLEQTRAIGYFS